MHWTDKLPKNACAEAIAWAKTQPSLKTAWRKCERGDWMLWLLGRLSGEPGSDARKRLVLCACDCAELSAHLADGDTQMAIAWCLTIARDWASGGEGDLDDVRQAVYAARAATNAAAYAAHAAHAAAYAAYAADYAAYAADYAAYAADYAAYAADYDSVIKVCANIVREHYPEPPVLAGDYCPKCKPRRKPRRRSRTTVRLVNSNRKTGRG